MRHLTLIGPRGITLRVEVAGTRRERMRGLLDREAIAPGDAMLIERARSVHTFGMRFPLRVLFLDRDFTVVHARTMRPGRLALPRRGVSHVLECHEGTDLRPGDRLGQDRAAVSSR
jgi:uncharacterized protein